MKDKVIALAKKLKALADRGIGGEKENAEVMLNRLLKENNLTILDVEGEQIDIRLIKYQSEEQKKFLNQVVASVMGKCSIWTHPQYKNTLIFEGTVAEFLEVKFKFRFYFVDFKRQETLFLKAYIQKNELYEKDSEPSDRDLTPAEKKELYDLWNMAAGIEKKKFNKPLDKGIKKIGEE